MQIFEIRETLNVEPLQRDIRYVGSAMWPERSARRVLSATLYNRESGPHPYQGPGGVITSPTYLGEQTTELLYQRLQKSVKYFKFSLGFSPCLPPDRKCGCKNESVLVNTWNSTQNITFN